MYKLHCKQLGSDCERPDHEVTGQTKEEVWEKIMEIGKRDHEEVMTGMDEAGLSAMKAKAWEVMSAQDQVEEAPAPSVDTEVPPAEGQN